MLELEVGLEDERQRRDRGVGRGLEPAHVRALGLDALVRGQRRAHGAELVGRMAVARRGAQLRHVGGGEALGPHRVHHDRVEAEPDRVAQPPLELDRLVDRHLLRQRDRDIARSAPGPRASRRPSPPGGGSARRARSRRTCAASSASRCRGRRRARRRRRGHRRGCAGPSARVCASSQTLAIVISSFAPGAAATKYWNACEWPRIAACGAAAELLAEPLLERLLRVDRDRPQVLGELDLLLRHARRGGRTRATSGPARRPRRRSSAAPSARRRARARRRPSSCRRRPCRSRRAPRGRGAVRPSHSP